MIMKEIEEMTDRKDFFTIAKESIGISKLKINFKKLDSRAVVPSYAHKGDVGMDFTAISVEYDKMNDLYIYHTGLSFESDEHYGMFIFPRSSNRKTDCYLANHVGIVDTATYRGEVMFCFKPRTSTYEKGNTIGLKAFMKALSEGKTAQEAQKEFEEARIRIFQMTEQLEFAPYKVGDRIGQMVILSYPDVELIEKFALSETERQDGGFGSTGN